MLDLVLPKGSLEQQTLLLFEDANLAVKRSSEREYSVSIRDPRIGHVKILRPQEIATYVEKGYFDLGITGLDWVRETNSDVVSVMDMAYNKQGLGAPVKIVLAVSNESGIEKPEQVPVGWRISTEYPNITRAYFEKLGIPVEVHLSYGATEAKVPEIADAVVEVTETGATLRRNGMRIIAVLLESTTQLVANRRSYEDPAKRGEIEEIKTLLAGVLTARGKVLIKLNVSEENLQAVVAIMPGMKAPTVSRLYGTDYYAVEAVAMRSEVNLLIPKLKNAGAEDILEIPISKIVL
jgi:ATP phosphoribosyltransferase